MNERHKITIANGTLIGSWEELKKIPLSTITKNDDDVELLDGLILKGYETKHGNGTNTNGERYALDAQDRFIEEYFIGKKLNMPVDVEHDPRPEWLVGRVVYIESNSTGFYYVAYIPRKHPQYNYVKTLLQEGILQGFSKCGWATDWEYHWKEDGSFDYEEVKEIQIVRMSIVSTPANGVTFERMQETKDSMTFVKVPAAPVVEPEAKTDKTQGSAFAAMFSK